MLGNNTAPNPDHIGWGAHSYGGGAGRSTYTQTLPNGGQWYHLASTRDNNWLKFYIDGVIVDSVDMAGTSPDYYVFPPTARIGSRRSLTQYTDGVIDDVRFFDCVLSAVEIANLFSDTASPPAPLLPYHLFFPNAFSPNGDGYNDVFAITGIGISSLQMSVYNRWGACVWGTDALTNAWDGNYNNKPLMPDIYTYCLSYIDVNGGTHQQKGQIFLLN